MAMDEALPVKRKRKASGGRTLREWLEEINLAQYADKLMGDSKTKLMGATGNDMLQHVLALGDLGLQHFGIEKMGHRCKIRYYAGKELDKQGVAHSVPQQEQPIEISDEDSEEAEEREEDDVEKGQSGAAKRQKKNDASSPAVQQSPPHGEDKTAVGGDEADGMQKSKQFLKAMKLENLIDKFVEEEVVWEDLKRLTTSDLTELGCKMGPRARITAHLPGSATPCKGMQCNFCDALKLEGFCTPCEEQGV